MNKDPQAQLRLTFKQEVKERLPDGSLVYEETPLAFAIAYLPEKKGWGPKNHRVQDEWAYKQYGFEYEYRDGVVYWRRVTYDYARGEVPKRVDHPWEQAPLQPRILENTPVTGFKIMHSVRRWSTGNKLWQIMDPRGFQLQISTENLADIIEETTIENGLIHGAYVWVADRTMKLVKG